jgi:hypothetical protein
VFQTYVANVSLDVSKVNLGVAIAIHICFKRMFQVFHLLHTYIANVSPRRCITKSGVAHVTMAIHAYFKLDLGRAYVAMAAVAGEQRLNVAACSAASSAPPWVTASPACMRCANGAGSEWSPRMRGHGQVSCVR